MTNLPPTIGDGSAPAPSVPAVPSHSPGSTEPGLLGFAPPAFASPAPAFAAPVAPIAYPYSWQEETRSNALGRVAFIVACVLLVLSLAASVLNGGLLGSLSGVAPAADALTDAQTVALGGGGIGVLAHLGLGTLLGLWALIQGIVAVATRRGRGFGVAAIVIATITPVLSFVLFSIAGNVSAAATL
ncbi:hypothetical protein WDJ51_03145 [Rathayibacter sp. YIM 133350]|uniref:hypothetical protein n=1 Tax=Rathayibacter sp. YIM 133350 TaxID=3131992 RepID=UPI00307EB613